MVFISPDHKAGCHFWGISDLHPLSLELVAKDEQPRLKTQIERQKKTSECY